MIPTKHRFLEIIKKLEDLTEIKFELVYNDEKEEDDKYTYIKYNNEVWFGGRDCYADLLLVLELCERARQKAFIECGR